MAHKQPLSRNEAYLQNALGEQHEMGDPQSRNEELLQELVDAIQNGGGIVSAIAFQTKAPTSDNTEGLKFVVLSSNPATKYDGYIYIITGE